MNVVLIFGDQHNPEFTGCYGGLTNTPNLDRLAERGVTFTNAYCNYPVCAPSKASMFTGRYAHEIGIWDNSACYDGTLPDWGGYLNDSGVCIARVGALDFAKEGNYGFRTHINPTFHDSNDVTGLCRGDYLVRRARTGKKVWSVRTRPSEEPNEPDLSRTEAAVGWLRDKRPADIPWLLEIGYRAPHPQWRPRPELYECYRNRVGRLAEKYYQSYEQLNRVEQVQSYYSCGYTGSDDTLPLVHAAYHATVEELDEQIGRVLVTLEETGVLDDTVVIYTSDHGEMLRAHGAWGKVSLYDDALRVPLIVAGAGVPSGVIERTPVSLIDLYPTVADILGVRKAVFARGDSVLRLVRSDSSPRRSHRFVFAESHLYPRITGSFAVRRDEWKLIDYIDHQPMLFNLQEDPQELNDLLARTESGATARAKLQELRECLYSVCSKEAVHRRALREQRVRRRELEESGEMAAGLRKRGFVWENEQLICVEGEG